MAKMARRTWVWRFDRPAETIWSVLADTARFNEAAGLPKQVVEETPQPDGSVQYIARARIGPFKLKWREEPVNWVANQWFRHCRHFHHGPLKSLCAFLRLIPEDGGCRCEYTTEVEPANGFGRLLLTLGLLRGVGWTFEPLVNSARDFAGGRRDTEFDYSAPALAPGAEARAATLVERIETTPYAHGLARRLADYVLSRPEVDMWSIRPLALAKKWSVPERDAIEVCLQAAKEGLLGLRWDLLCPRCQVGKTSASALDQLPTGSHCSTCNIDYEREYTKNVELAFYPGVAIRRLTGGEYCLFGPMSTPHIRLHLTLAPGETRAVEVELPRGNYRLRTLEPGGEDVLQWDEDGFPEVIASGERVRAGPAAEPGKVILRNESDRALTLIVEERAWRRDALTAHRATALQAFRDLFNKDVLRPGDHVEIDRITLMFTDLKGSTALYERIGDPRAYGLVREHYAVLGKAVREHNGTIVKTIGDAIMGAFANPADALRCAIQLHGDFTRFNAVSGKEPITIKLGLHVGRCIAVTLNDRLDYYGTAANRAARLEGQSQGGDIVMSPEFAEDPAVKSVLAPFSPRHEQATLKGFNEPVCFLRITAEELAAKRAFEHPERPANQDRRPRTAS